LRLMDEEQRVLGEVPVLQKALDASKAETGARLHTIETDEKKERDEAGDLERQRQALVARLPAIMRTRYERIRASLDGRAVVPIIKGSCGGCFRGQPPQMLQEAKRGDRAINCDGCGRLVVWPPHAG